MTLGPGTVGRVVITRGIASGERLALRDPKRSADETVAEAARRSGGGARGTGGSVGGGSGPSEMVRGSRRGGR